jgi:hypothetical protein
MNNLTYGQKWVLVAFTAAILTTATTFFLDGDVRTFAYIVISMGVAAYAVLAGKPAEKSKDS